MPVTSVQFDLPRGERLLWSGVPRQGVVLRASDAYAIPFSFLWAGFAVFWETSVIRSGAPGFFMLWGIPFVLVGAYITIGRFFLDAWRRRRTSYGVTSERVIVSGGFSRQLTSLDLRTLGQITLDQKLDGTGTITFGAAALLPTRGLSGAQATWFAGTPWPGVRLPPMFEMISDAKRVYEIVREAQHAATAPAPAAPSPSPESVRR